MLSKEDRLVMLMKCAMLRYNVMPLFSLTLFLNPKLSSNYNFFLIANYKKNYKNKFSFFFSFETEKLWLFTGRHDGSNHPVMYYTPYLDNF